MQRESYSSTFLADLLTSVDKLLVRQVVLKAQGCKLSRSTPTLLSVQALDYVTGNYSCGHLSITYQ